MSTTTSSKPVLTVGAYGGTLQPQRVHLVSLGCPKNRIDSEVMVGKLQAGAYELVPDPSDADVIVVNTCSIREKAEDKVYSFLGPHARRKQRGGQ